MSSPGQQGVPGLDFVAIDFETANRTGGSACSVGLIRVRDGLIIKERHWLMQPPQSLRGGHFEPRNIAVHGITWPMVAGEPTFAQRHPLLIAGLADDLLVAHNAAFDRDVLAKACIACGLDGAANPWRCTRDLARDYLDLPGYRLPEVTAALGLPAFDHHDALADSRACARILIALVERDPTLLRALRIRPGHTAFART